MDAYRKPAFFVGTAAGLIGAIGMAYTTVGYNPMSLHFGAFVIAAPLTGILAAIEHYTPINLQDNQAALVAGTFVGAALKFALCSSEVAAAPSL